MGAAEELEYLTKGPAYDVAVLQSVNKVFRKLPVRSRAGLGAIMVIFGREGGINLPRTQYTFESRLSIGDSAGTTVGIYCFKDWQVRIYGSVVPVHGKPTFVGTEIDDAKKQNKADQGCLTRAAHKLKPFIVDAKEKVR